MQYLKVVVIVLILHMAATALACPPSAIYANYDSNRHELNVTVQHIVTKRAEHFVKEIIVYKNGEEVARREFDFQTSHRNQTMPPIPLQAIRGDKIRIVAFCNTSGKYEKDLTVVR